VFELKFYDDFFFFNIKEVTFLYFFRFFFSGERLQIEIVRKVLFYKL
jgi:hypothetical protein